MQTPYFEMRNITKYFAKVVANFDVSLSVDKGQVLALLGENGAGKSTIMKILYGLYKADSGKIFKNGVEQKIGSPKDAMALGVSMIQQHFSLVPAHTVTENIILGNVKGIIDFKACSKEIQQLADSYEFNIDANALVRDLSVGEQQKVEILKALYQNTGLLIMDEPTAVLTPQEADNLVVFMRNFVEKGNSIIFITHKMKEVMRGADTIVVMREGKVAGTLETKNTNEAELSRLMIGKDLQMAERESDTAENFGPLRLKLSHVSLAQEGEIPQLNDVSFELHQGEILGIAGVSGNGQSELCEVVCGVSVPSSGTIELDGKDMTKTSIREHIDGGIGYVPADRHRDGMVMDMSIAENMMLKTSFNKKWLYNHFLDKKKLNTIMEEAIQEYNIKAPGPEAVAKGLSGGNQQKVIVAREVANGEKLIVFDQPTRGLDLGAINNVHQAILNERAKGKSILLVSTELSEIFALSDRIAVLFKGKIQGIFRREELTTEKIGLLMAGYHDTGEAAQ